MLYIGSKNGPEGDLIKKLGIPFMAIPCGKLRRYFSFKNFVDMWKIPMGVIKAYRILKKFKPDSVFAKGGFVSMPVVLAASRLKIPIILHESDVIPGLTNKSCARYADKICISFEATRPYFSKYADKIVMTGNPVRAWLKDGNKEKGDKPVLLVIGGSQGALQINELIMASLDELLNKFQIVHIRGRGNLDKSISRRGYTQYEYLGDEMKDIYAISDVVVSRGGANSLAELAFLKKRAVIIPLGKDASRGDQIVNAEEFAKNFGFTVLIEDVSREIFIKSITEAYAKPLPSADFVDGTKKIVDLILQR